MKLAQSLAVATTVLAFALAGCGGTTNNNKDGGTGGGTGSTGGGTASTGGGSGSTGGGGGSKTGGGSGSTGGGSGSTGGGSGSTGGGSGSTGGGSGGTGGGSGSQNTIAAAKSDLFSSNDEVYAQLDGVVVTGVSFTGKSGSSNNCDGASSPGTNASFWVADPNNPQNAIWVDKFRCDPEIDYTPQVGDVLNLKGYIGFDASFTDTTAFRVVFKSQFSFIPSASRPSVCTLPACQPLEITKVSTMSPLPKVEVPSTFGNAMGGTVKANSQYSGAYVHIAGPLTLSDASPLAMKRISALPNDTRYNGFELSNGVLVNNFKTFASFESDGGIRADGGTSQCDWRMVILDGGAVSFPNGVSGIWDTYSMAPCADGGTASGTNCFRNRGYIPGTPDANYTNVLYPLNCSDISNQ